MSWLCLSGVLCGLSVVCILVSQAHTGDSLFTLFTHFTTTLYHSSTLSVMRKVYNSRSTPCAESAVRRRMC